MTDATLVQIFNGELREWPGEDLIRLVLRQESESDIQVLMEQVPGFRDAFAKATQRPNLPTAYSDQENNELLEKSPGSFGVTTLGQVLGERRSLMVFPFNGVLPSAATIADGSYPMAKDFLFVTGPDPHPMVRNFMHFVCKGEGVAFLQDLGYQLLRD